eukprot:m.108224 g.108224  ORF g.108224 m.108224 type:complete len:210 (+) comp15330_c0_seq24:785-1414(+)
MQNEDGDVLDGPNLTQDEGIRATTAQKLSQLRPSFQQDGTTTAGNSSQVSDGAAAVLLARRSVAKAKGLPILARYRGFAVAGVPPAIMGIGPAIAIPKVLKQVGLTIHDIDVFELNEAFASQAVYCIKKLGLDPRKVNPNGGAIALGHPLGCTGARQVATLLSALRRTGQKHGVVSMCIGKMESSVRAWQLMQDIVGTGMGAAAVFSLE